MRSIVIGFLFATFVAGCASEPAPVDPGSSNVTERWKIAWAYEVLTTCPDTAGLYRPFASKFVVQGTSSVGLDRHGAIVTQTTVLDSVTTDSVVQCPTRSTIEVSAPTITRASAPIEATVNGGFYPLGETTKDSVVLNISAKYLAAVVRYERFKPSAATQHDTLGPGTVGMNLTINDVRDGGTMVKTLQPLTVSSSVRVRATLTKLPL